ncbi:hypothetical protein CS022_00750 [Veronia nyctiphanis]|uniref:Uncharacterized protein n=1 Tax=Veronia nyctiphanis TaxID=1278244 RepID=A0A4Q0YVF0_9GAMM|nr:hypothetical protein [Veronia nyctiphanis]RXJ74785.1 hypothetical protein CS022_00750 [Veronia nyctiphanis]
MRSVITTLITALMFSPLVNAHPGHDHSHWSSYAIHAGWIGSLALAVVIGLTVVRRRMTNGKDKK